MIHSLLIRITVAIILLMHSIPGMLDGGVHAFGTQYLNAVGFAPLGLYLAWLIKLSHIATAISLVLNKYIKWAAVGTILILLAGIVMVHYPEGWYVVGGGRNGMEFNVLLIAIFLSLAFSKDRKTVR